MPGSWIFQATLFIFALTVFAAVLGEYMAKVYNGEHTFFSPVMVPIENFLYQLFGIDKTEDMDWKTYAMSFVWLSIIGIIALYLLQIFQDKLPFNPQKLAAMRWDTALNTAISFVTNTNWQAYASESTTSHLTKMLGLTLQNFLSAACGMAIAVALIRAFIRKNCTGIGNFWVDLVRSIIYLLLPLALILAIVLVSQGVIDNLNPNLHIHTLAGKEQIITQGPAAAEVAIKHLGTNGGGFFNANSAHPFENPTPLTDYLEVMAMLIIAAAFPFTLGAMLNNRKQGTAIYIAMLTLFIIGLIGILLATHQGNPLLAKIGIYHGVNLEGLEVRLGQMSSAFFAQVTTASSTGAVNASYTSFMPLAGLVTIFNMAIGECIFGGVGSGFYCMLLYALLTMFLIGLMVGRSPEIYGKKLEPFEMSMVIIALIIPCIIQLIMIATAIIVQPSTTAGPHALSDVIYAFASSVGNNGSAFASLKSNTVFYNITTGIAMLIGRFATAIPVLAIAGSLVQKKLNPASARFPTTSPIFIFVLIGVVITVGALTFFPALVLGPVLEHLAIFAGQSF